MPEVLLDFEMRMPPRTSTCVGDVRDLNWKSFHTECKATQYCGGRAQYQSFRPGPWFLAKNLHRLNAIGFPRFLVSSTIDADDQIDDAEVSK